MARRAGRPSCRRRGVRWDVCGTLLLSGVLCLAGCDESPQPAGAVPAAGGVSAAGESPAPTADRPNILLIVADDLGYTDLGAFGSEVETPRLDELAAQGVLLSQFYASPMCSPTRAMLLSGVDNHRAGMGTLHEKIADNQVGERGYEGHLPDRIATLPALLRPAGYRTYMAGKWHLGEAQEHSPAAAGFDRSFALIESGAGHFGDMQSLSDARPALYREDGERVEALPEDFYSTRFYADRLIEYIEQDRAREQPFFGYLAFTAPHFPLQAPAESLAKYAGRYDEGYDALHVQRLRRLEALGLLDGNVEAFPRLPHEQPWGSLSREAQRISARRMEIYAAMIDDLDRHVGRVVDYLEAIGELRDTLIVFMSDNGAEGHWLHQGLLPLHEWSQECCDDSYENMGRPGSYVMLGPNWARAATGPYQLFKGFTSEGGIRVPAFLRYPAAQSGSRRIEQPLTVLDVMPTVLEVAGVEHPAPEFEGRRVLAPEGRSMVPLLRDDPPVHGDTISLGWEFLGKRAYRHGDWKIVWHTDLPSWQAWPADIQPGRWQLYDLSRDPGERHDLSAQHPQKRDELVALWESYARDNWVVLPDRLSGY